MVQHKKVTVGHGKNLSNIVGEQFLVSNCLLSNYTSFRIGGSADYLVFPTHHDMLISLIRYANECDLPWTLLGNCTNVLVSDQGVRGLVIHTGKYLNRVQVEGTLMRAQSGTLLCAMAVQAVNCGLTGLEIAGGIPGTIGGAIYMNAGAYGWNIQDAVKRTRVYDPVTDAAFDLSVEEHRFGYRTSRIKEENLIILESELRLSRLDEQTIRQTMATIGKKRRMCQPLDQPSAGSIFKRPEGNFAGKLIEDAGLKGFGIGDAYVSEKHAGFIVNAGSATALQVDRLIDTIITTVYERYGVRLETEIIRIGEGFCDDR